MHPTWRKLLIMLGFGWLAMPRARLRSVPSAEPPGPPGPLTETAETETLIQWPVPAGTMPTADRLRYGIRRTPTHVHQGIDICAPEGSSVLTPLTGTVVRTVKKWTGGFSGYGKVVLMEYPASPATGGKPLYGLFAHLSAIDVKAGDVLARGSRLGFVGKTKYTRKDKSALFVSSGSHLHIEMMRDPYLTSSPKSARRIDPEKLLQGAWERQKKAL